MKSGLFPDETWLDVRVRLKFLSILFRIRSNSIDRRVARITRGVHVVKRGFGLCGAGLVLVFSALASAVAGASLDLQADRAVSTDGVVQLRWLSPGQAVVLQRAHSADFAVPRMLYQGTDTASVRTGLSDGDYFYRVGALDADVRVWSAPVQVTVRHHDALRTWGLFGVGVAVFLATLGLILFGWARETKHG